MLSYVIKMITITWILQIMLPDARQSLNKQPSILLAQIVEPAMHAHKICIDGKLASQEDDSAERQIVIKQRKTENHLILSIVIYCNHGN